MLCQALWLIYRSKSENRLLLYGSYGYTYAKEHNISYVLLDEVLPGDANRDGETDVNDATVLQGYLAEFATEAPIATRMTQ